MNGPAYLAPPCMALPPTVRLTTDAEAQVLAAKVEARRRWLDTRQFWARVRARHEAAGRTVVCDMEAYR